MNAYPPGTIDFGDPRLPQRFWNKIEPQPDGCWHWTACLSQFHYGKYSVTAGRPKFAHRVAYETLIEPIPEGGILDHRCHDPEVCNTGWRNCLHRRCANPAHLQLTTHAENLADGRRVSANRLKTECRRGHPFVDGSYSVKKSGGRACKECQRISNAARSTVRATREGVA